ncbi:MAG TPA: FKBP-type peptidyl-prolyl cis-trans isomerase [Verrucomicrobiae bacterium]|nr:FKBP-type peptidyl-prolyl cis-trans isomerase [Verrucomicrobiae bacterium]
MKKASLIFTGLASAVLFTGCNKNNQPTPPASGATNSAAATTNGATATSANTAALTTDKERESYAVGMLYGTGLKKNGVDVDIDTTVRGLKDSQSGGPTLLTEDQMKTELTTLQHSLVANRQKAQAQEGQQNEQEGAAFLAHNKTQPGVVTLPDGLQYKVIKDGTGPTPSPSDIVTVNYKGTFVNGTEFDSSFKRGKPAEFPVAGVIPGWTEALEKMKVGSKWEIYVPSNLAYGPSGREPLVGPNETLVFEVELLDVKARPAPAQAQPLTSDIIKVPSAEDMKKGAKIETIKAQDLQKMEQAASNNPSTNK